MQIKRQRTFERFSMREHTFTERIDDDQFPSLFAIREFANKTLAYALQWSMGKLKIDQWTENVNFIDHLLENLNHRSHAWAILELKKYFGDSKGLSKKLKRRADNTIREASRPHEWVQPGVHGNGWFSATIYATPISNSFLWSSYASKCDAPARRGLFFMSTTRAFV